MPESYLDITGEKEAVAKCEYDAAQLTVIEGEVLEVLDRQGAFAALPQRRRCPGLGPASRPRGRRARRLLKGGTMSEPILPQRTSGSIGSYVHEQVQDPIRFHAGDSLAVGHHNQQHRGLRVERHRGRAIAAGCRRSTSRSTGGPQSTRAAHYDATSSLLGARTPRRWTRPAAEYLLPHESGMSGWIPSTSSAGTAASAWRAGVPEPRRRQRIAEPAFIRARAEPPLRDAAVTESRSSAPGP